MYTTSLIQKISSRISSLLALIISISSRLISSTPKKSNPSKIAFFTEGQTEQIFIERLLREWAAHREIKITSVWALGGTRRLPRKFYQLAPEDENNTHRYYALIHNCGSDGRVISDVRERYQNLIEAGYTAIVAIRDVAPDFRRDEVPRAREGFSRALPTNPITPTIVLATMEVEAWFLGEHSHFPRIDPSLEIQNIFDNTGIDLENGDVEARAKPADDLNIIYQLAGLQYSKSMADVSRTVNALNFDIVRSQLQARSPSFKPLADALINFF